MYFRNFDPNKSKNPFAYFTQIIYYAKKLGVRITKEKKQLYVKYKATEQYGEKCITFKSLKKCPTEDHSCFVKDNLNYMII